LATLLDNVSVEQFFGGPAANRHVGLMLVTPLEQAATPLHGISGRAIGRGGGRVTLNLENAPIPLTSPQTAECSSAAQLLPSEDLKSRTSTVPKGVIDCISVDVEDYFQVEAFAAKIPRSRWPLYPARVRQNTERTLALLKHNGCQATFFVLGWVAERDPALIRTIAALGHEIACHSHLHRPLHTITPSEFRTDLRRSRSAIEDAAGVRVVGFRAPTFSVTEKTLWALEVLAEEGFEYDSSIFPIRHDLYGMPDAPRWVHEKKLPSGQALWEIPPATVRIGRVNLPFGGGGYLRVLPMFFTRWAIKTTHRRERQPVIVYFHPWELDPDQPRLSGSWRSRFRHYSGLTETAHRLQEILSQGSFQPLIALVRSMQKSALVMQAAAS
jgi:polysaccharide deacetylase family protein (PEP-CTERM system associated)